MQIINPATEEVIKDIEEDNVESLDLKFKELKSAQLTWASRTLEDRVTVLKKFSELLEENKEQLSRVLTSEVGKPLQQSRNEISGAQLRIKWITENAGRYLSEELMSESSEMKESIRYEPLGVVCNISAWNYPYLVGINVFVPALIAGNAVMYKPSEYSTLTGMEIQKLLINAGVPENVFQIAIGSGTVGALLTEIPFNGYFFTGSYKTGKYIYEKLAAKMVPCHLELGGKDPLYVTGDVTDIAKVAASTADGAFYNNGQSCCAVERIYVQEKVYDKYVEELVKEVQSWKTGSPLEDGVYLGPLTRKEQPAYLAQQVEDAVAKGATIVTGGHRINARGYYFEPTVLVNVTHEMSVMKEESFGPVIGIMKVKDDREAITLMQDTRYGLTASVYSADQHRAENILQQLNTGTGYWNCCDRVSAALPWSGRNHSGFGVSLSHAGLRSFVKTKAYQLRKGYEV